MIQSKLASIKKTHHPSGQIAIVILLIMVVLLTVGLSLASRTTQELFLSQQESESARVFNAAEVGLEDALSQDFDLIGDEFKTLPESTTVNEVTTVTTINPNNTLETQIVEGSAVHIDLSGYPGTTMTVDWARETDCTAASVLVSIYYDHDGVTKVVHEALGATNGSGLCESSSDFTPILVGNPPYSFSSDVSLPKTSGQTPLFARIRAVYNDTSIRVSGHNLPTQFFTIRSAANTDVGEESRTVEVGRTLSGAPSFMDYAVYSGGGIQIEETPD
jgi:Tfp pilus assembly protein PilX